MRMTPEEFGRAPMGGPPPPVIMPPYQGGGGGRRGPFPMPPPPSMGPVMGYPEQRLGMFNGGYLNTGISQLPTNQQGDTLTQQVFQSGFQPRR